MPIFLDRLVGPIIAVVLSVSGVLIFGEIIPQAVCSRYGLAISARCAWLIWFLIAIVFPVSYPVSLLLDCILGHESTMYRRAEIKQFIGLHAEPSSRDGSVQGDASGSGAGNGTGGSEHTLTVDEANVIRAAIDLSSKTVADVMTPIDDVFMVDETTQLTRPVMEMLVQRGFSRVPVFRRDRSHVVGVMLMKQLILVSHEQGVPISSLPLRAMPIVPSTMDCYGALDMFQLGRSHIAMVVDRKDMLTLVGCVTLEDIIEELLNEEIADEAGAALAPRGSKDWGGTRSIDEPLLRASGNFNRTESVAGSYADPRAVPRLHLTESGSISDTSESIRHTIDAAHHSLHHASTTHTAATTAVPAGFARARSAAQTRFRRNLDERRPLLRASMHLEDPVGDVIRVVDSPNSNYNSINTNEQ